MNSSLQWNKTISPFSFYNWQSFSSALQFQSVYKLQQLYFLFLAQKFQSFSQPYFSAKFHLVLLKKNSSLQLYNFSSFIFSFSPKNLVIFFLSTFLITTNQKKFSLFVQVYALENFQLISTLAKLKSYTENGPVQPEEFHTTIVWVIQHTNSINTAA